ncbi:MAG: hypothetical protein HRU03_00155 [Nanoarchaeales archaeon]|nr:hypothetical protein [Nanoarchaeales archaeon]
MITNNKLTKPLEVLVVEDMEHHINDAKRTFMPLVEKGLVFFDYATTLLQAQLKIDNKKYDGIISDIFFPTGQPEPLDKSIRENLYERALIMGRGYREEDFKKVYSSWRNGETAPPSGVILSSYCNNKFNSIPFVACTDGFHHGVNLHFIRSLFGGEYLIDSDPTDDYWKMFKDEDPKASHKNWGKAFDMLVPSMISKKDLGLIKYDNLTKMDNIHKGVMSILSINFNSLEFIFKNFNNQKFFTKKEIIELKEYESIYRSLLFRK